MPCQIYRYPAGMGWHGFNLAATIGAFLIALSVLILLINVFTSLRSGELAEADRGMGGR